MILVNGEEIKSFIFPGGEIHLRTHWQNSEVRVKSIMKTSDDIMELLLLCDVLKRKNCTIDLEIPYIPYARQDRVCNEGEPFSIKVFADIINSIKASRVVGWDVHSDVTSALINNFYNTPIFNILELDLRMIHLLKNSNVVLCSPDAGAEKKVYSVAKYFQKDWIIRASKLRNTITGEIVNTELNVGYLKGEIVLIIDDICDGGRTFIELAKKLKNKGSSKIILYVTHGIFSKGIDVFDGLIDEIWTANLFNKIKHEKLNIIGENNV